MITRYQLCVLNAFVLLSFIGSFTDVYAQRQLPNKYGGLGLDLEWYCKKKHGASAKIVLREQNAYGWKCLVAGQDIGLDISEACKLQYGQSTPFGMENPSDPEAWYCVPRAGFRACNKTSTQISIAIAVEQWTPMSDYGSTKYFMSQGWSNVPAGECRLIYSGAAREVVGIHAIGGGQSWGNGSSYCVKTGSFEHRTKFLPTCDQIGGKLTKFIDLKTSANFDTFIFR